MANVHFLWGYVVKYIRTTSTRWGISCVGTVRGRSDGHGLIGVALVHTTVSV